MLQFITHHTARRDEIDGTRAVYEGGCRWVQLRMKEAADEEYLRTGREVGRQCHANGATILLNDRVHLVAELGADGVHLGKNDMPPREARALQGHAKNNAATANTFDDIVRAAAEGADNLGFGPFRFTEPNRNLSPLHGLEGYRRIAAQCREGGIALPVVAIGGLNKSNILELSGTGVDGVALVSAIFSAEDIESECRELRALSEKMVNA